MPVNNKESSNLLDEANALLEEIDAFAADPPVNGHLDIENIMKSIEHRLNEGAANFFKTKKVMHVCGETYRTLFFTTSTKKRSEGAYLLAGVLNRLADEGYVALGHLAKISQLEFNNGFIVTLAYVAFTEEDCLKIEANGAFVDFAIHEGAAPKGSFTNINHHESDITDERILELDTRKIVGDDLSPKKVNK